MAGVFSAENSPCHDPNAHGIPPKGRAGYRLVFWRPLESVRDALLTWSPLSTLVVPWQLCLG
eukprot:2826086-Amphidinium_carterae.1